MKIEDPYEKIKKFREEILRLFDKYGEVDVLTALGNKERKASFELPKVNLKEKKKEYIYEIALPGVDKEGIEVEIIGNRLIIKAEKREKVRKEKENILYQEMSSVGFYRELPLKEDVDIKKVKASYKDGLLKIVIPKKAVKEKAKKIRVE